MLEFHHIQPQRAAECCQSTPRKSGERKGRGREEGREGGMDGWMEGGTMENGGGERMEARKDERARQRV